MTLDKDQMIFRDMSKDDIRDMAQWCHNVMTYGEIDWSYAPLVEWLKTYHVPDHEKLIRVFTSITSRFLLSIVQHTVPL